MDIDRDKEGLKGVDYYAIEARLKLMVKFNKELISALELKDDSLREVDNTISNLLYKRKKCMLNTYKFKMV